MKKINQLKLILAKHKSAFKKKYRGKKLGLFGSYVKGMKQRLAILILVYCEKSIVLEKNLEFGNLVPGKKSFKYKYFDITFTNKRR